MRCRNELGFGSCAAVKPSALGSGLTNSASSNSSTPKLDSKNGTLSTNATAGPEVERNATSNVNITAASDLDLNVTAASNANRSATPDVNSTAASDFNRSATSDANTTTDSAFKIAPISEPNSAGPPAINNTNQTDEPQPIVILPSSSRPNASIESASVNPTDSQNADQLPAVSENAERGVKDNITTDKSPQSTELTPSNKTDAGTGDQLSAALEKIEKAERSKNVTEEPTSLNKTKAENAGEIPEQAPQSNNVTDSPTSLNKTEAENAGEIPDTAQQSNVTGNSTSLNKTEAANASEIPVALKKLEQQTQDLNLTVSELEEWKEKVQKAIRKAGVNARSNIVSSGSLRKRNFARLFSHEKRGYQRDIGALRSKAPKLLRIRKKGLDY